MKNTLIENYKNFSDNTKFVHIPPFPRRIMLEVTDRCNHQCIFCAHANAKRTRGKMEPSVYVRLLEEAFSLGTRECAFHGGSEPFMHPNLHDVVATAKNIGYTYLYLTTNGSACSKNKMQKVLDAGLDSIKFSINAGTAEDYLKVHGKDNFEKVLDMVAFVAEYRKKKEQQLKLYVSAIICSANQSQIKNLDTTLCGLVDCIEYLTACWTGKSTKIPLKELKARSFPGKICSEPFNRLTISANGYVRACCNDVDNFLAIGDATNNSLEDIWKGEMFVQLRRWLLEDKLPTNSLCYNCSKFVDGLILPLHELIG